MEHKDLAKEYALAKLQGKLNGNEPIFSENIVFTDKDIEFAFNAGRESVVENTTKLIWEDKGRGPIAKTIFNLSYIIYFFFSDYLADIVTILLPLTTVVSTCKISK